MRLREGLSWCLCRDRAVFLDLEHDRYFCLPAAHDTAFRRWFAGEAAAIDALVARGVLVPGEAGAGGNAPPVIATPLRDLSSDPESRVRMRDVARAVLAQRHAGALLRRRRFADILAGGDPYRRRHDPAGGEAQARRVAAAFAASTLILRAADRCLVRALAARALCRAYGVRPALVFGVRIDPFAAHCWVQQGDAVIVGDVEQARLFTPILAVP